MDNTYLYNTIIAAYNVVTMLSVLCIRTYVTIAVKLYQCVRTIVRDLGYLSHFKPFRCVAVQIIGITVSHTLTIQRIQWCVT